MRVVSDGIVAHQRSKRSETRKEITGRSVLILNVGQAVSHRNKVHVSDLFPVIVFISNIGNFQLGVLEDFALDGQIPLPGIGICPSDRKSTRLNSSHVSE